MANIEKGSTFMSLSPSTDSAIGRIDGERHEDIKSSLQLEELSSGSINNKRKQKASSDSVLGTKFEGPSKKSKGTTSFIGHKRNISEEEINGRERSKKDSLPTDHSQDEADISLKEKVYAGEEEEVTSKEQSKECLHNDVAHNEVDHSLKGKASADKEVDVINDAVKETGSSVGKGDGKAPWVNTFDLNGHPEVEEDQA